MNRDIIFRGKSVNDGAWVYGAYFDNGVKKQIITVDDNDSNDEDDFTLHEVIPETVGQLTGLTDKAGLTDIYEGDIVANFNFDHPDFRDEVIFQNGAFGYTAPHEFVSFAQNINFQWVDGKSDRILVVGNRWDNPELSKEVEDK